MTYTSKHHFIFQRTNGICSTKCLSFQFKQENNLPQRAFKVNTALAAVETWHLEDCMLQVKVTCQMQSNNLTVSVS